jgi:hypothetical protein
MLAGPGVDFLLMLNGLGGAVCAHASQSWCSFLLMPAGLGVAFLGHAGQPPCGFLLMLSGLGVIFSHAIRHFFLMLMLVGHGVAFCP